MSKRPVRKKARTEAVALTADEIKVVQVQFQKDTSFARFDDLLNEYTRYLHLKLSDTDKPFAPSYLIDRLWHAHILSTREYLAFCERYNHGDYLHHDPTMRRGQRRYTETLDQYQKLFGEAPTDKEIWPDHVDEKPKVAIKMEDGVAVKQEDVEESDDAAVEGMSAEGDEQESESESSGSNDDSAESGEEFEFTSNCSSAERQAQLEYYQEYGEARGKTIAALKEWHKEIITQTEEVEDPCPKGHYWIKGEFDINCEGCRESSQYADSYVCG